MEQKVERQSKRLRKGDRVVIISGNHRGAIGEILSRTATHAIVQGVNFRKKNIRKSEQHPAGAVVDIERPIHLSNMMLYVDQRPVKLYASYGEDGAKRLQYKSEGGMQEHRILRKVKQVSDE